MIVRTTMVTLSINLACFGRATFGTSGVASQKITKKVPFLCSDHITIIFDCCTRSIRAIEVDNCCNWLIGAFFLGPAGTFFFKVCWRDATKKSQIGFSDRWEEIIPHPLILWGSPHGHCPFLLLCCHHTIPKVIPVLFYFESMMAGDFWTWVSLY